MPRIEEMYAFVAEDSGPDDEGVVGMATKSGWMPLVGADMARVESLKPGHSSSDREENQAAPLHPKRRPGRRLRAIKGEGD